MSWFYRHKTFSMIAAVLLVLLILLLVSVALKDKDNALGTVARTIVSGFQKPFAAMASGIGNLVNASFSDDVLYAENKDLREQLEEAQSELTISRLDREELEELKNLQEIFNSGANIEDYTVQSANVISLEGSSIYSIFSIDMGTKVGVDRNTVVLNGDGLIGRVITAEKNSAKVVPILNESNKIGFQIQGESNYLGICNGDGEGKLVGSLLDEEATVNVGDTVLTSGIGGIYPAGIKLGTVLEAELTSEGPLIHVVIEPNVYFKGLKKVAVLV